MRPVSVSGETIEANHHALFLDLITLDPSAVPQLAKYRIHGLTREEWKEGHTAPALGPKFQELHGQASRLRNVKRNYSVFLKLLNRNFSTKLRKQTTRNSMGSSEAFEIKSAQHEKSPKY